MRLLASVLARPLRAAADGADRRLRRQRRALRQGRRLCDPERGRGLDRADRRQLHRYHGFAAIRNGHAARAGRASRSGRRPSTEPTAHDARHPHQLGTPGDTRRHRRERRGAGAALRARARARPGRQHLHRQGRPGAARHAVGVHRHRPGARRLPAHRRRVLRQRHLAQRPQPGRGAAAADRAAGLRGPDAHRAGDQGPDRHQGRAAVDPDLDRRAPARLPAAGRAHRHLAEDRLAGAARAAAHAHDGALAGRGRRHGRGRRGQGRRRLHPAHQRRRGERRGARRRHPLPEEDLEGGCASAPSSRRRERCCTRT